MEEVKLSLFYSSMISSITFKRAIFSQLFSTEMVNLMCSCGKTLTAIMMGMMVDRGLLQYSERLSKYWPQFAQKGKEEVSEHFTKGSHFFVSMSANR
jgi:hypothetical protein